MHSRPYLPHPADVLLHTGLHCRPEGKRSLPVIQDALAKRIEGDSAAKARLREAARRVFALKGALLGPSVAQRQSPSQQQQRQPWHVGAEQLLALSRGPEVVAGIAKSSIALVSDGARLLPLGQTFASEAKAKCVPGAQPATGGGGAVGRLTPVLPGAGPCSLPRRWWLCPC